MKPDICERLHAAAVFILSGRVNESGGRFAFEMRPFIPYFCNLKIDAKEAKKSIDDTENHII